MLCSWKNFYLFSYFRIAVIMYIHGNNVFLFFFLQPRADWHPNSLFNRLWWQFCEKKIVKINLKNQHKLASTFVNNDSEQSDGFFKHLKMYFPLPRDCTSFWLKLHPWDNVHLPMIQISPPNRYGVHRHWVLNCGCMSPSRGGRWYLPMALQRKTNAYTLM